MENQGIKIDLVESRSKARRIKLYKECRVTFVKKDGSVRKMHARMDGNPPTKGGTSTLDPEKYTTVWDVDSEGYRAINNDTIIEFEVIE
jgi:hypothetical protein